jgi:hypothetical protein
MESRKQQVSSKSGKSRGAAKSVKNESPASPSPTTLVPKMLYVVPTVFNTTTHDKMPSISPRPAVEYKSDSKTERGNAKYLSNHPELYSLLVHMENEILRNKPENIGSFLGDFFDASNETQLKEYLKLAVPSFEV